MDFRGFSIAGSQGPPGPPGPPFGGPVIEMIFTEQAAVPTVLSGTVALYAGLDNRLKRKRDDQSVDSLTEDTQLAAYVQKAGSTMTGQLIGTTVLENTFECKDQPSVATTPAGQNWIYSDSGDSSRLKSKRVSTVDTIAYLSDFGPTGPYLPLAGGTMIGPIDMQNFPIKVNTLDADLLQPLAWGASTTATSASTTVVGHGSNVGAQSATFGYNITSTGTSNVCMGEGCTATGNFNVALGFDNDCTTNGAMCLGHGLVNTTADSLLIGHSVTGLANIRPNTNGLADLGATGSGWRDLYLTGNILGAGGDDIVKSTSTSTTGHLSSFTSSTGRVIQDSGIPSANVVLSTSTSTSSHLASFYSGTGKEIGDSGINGGDVVLGPASAVGSHIALFADSTGKLLSDSGATLSQYLPLTGGTMTGSIDMGANDIKVNTLDADASQPIKWGGSVTATAGSTTVAGHFASVGAHTDNSILGYGITSTGDANTCVGRGCSATGNFNVALGYNNSCSANGAMCLGHGLINSTADSLLIGQDITGLANIRPNTNGLADLGATGNRWKDLYLTGSIVGAGGADLVSSTATSTTGNLSSFTSSTGRIIQDSGIVSANVVTSTSTSTTSHLASFTSGTGRVVQDAGILSTDVVLGPASAVSGNVVLFSGTSGKLLSDSGATLSQYLPLSGGTMTGDIALGTHSLTGATSVLATTIDTNSGVTLNVGTSTATAVTIGKAAQTNTLVGITTMTQAYASWGCTTNNSPSFTNAVAKAIALSTSTTLFSNEFSIGSTTGIMTYTGTRTRQVKLTYNISMRLPTAGSEMYFWIDKNPAGTPASPANVQAHFDLTTANKGTRVQLTLSDMFSVATNDTLQLIGFLDATDSSAVFNFVSCQVVGLFN